MQYSSFWLNRNTKRERFVERHAILGLLIDNIRYTLFTETKENNEISYI